MGKLDNRLGQIERLLEERSAYGGFEQFLMQLHRVYGDPDVPFEEEYPEIPNRKEWMKAMNKNLDEVYGEEE